MSKREPLVTLPKHLKETFPGARPVTYQQVWTAAVDGRIPVVRDGHRLKWDRGDEQAIAEGLGLIAPNAPLAA